MEDGKFIRRSDSEDGGKMDDVKQEKKDEKRETPEDNSTTNEQHHHSDSIVREGVIDLESIDKNKDGNLFQDMMDWNVISDEPGRCPLCNMKLKEATLEEVKANLEKNGFEYKK